MNGNLSIYIITGKARHGKTTVANMIKDYCESLGVAAVVTSYNKYIKMFAIELTDWDGSEESKPRTLLQTLGSEIIREKLGHQDFFVKRLDQDMEVYNEFVDAVMIDDARLPIEIEYFKEKYPEAVKVFHVDRPNYDNGLNSSQLSHETENALDNYDSYDYTIINDGTLDELKAKVYKLMEEIKK